MIYRQRNVDSNLKWLKCNIWLKSSFRSSWCVWMCVIGRMSLRVRSIYHSPFISTCHESLCLLPHMMPHISSCVLMENKRRSLQAEMNCFILKCVSSSIVSCLLALCLLPLFQHFILKVLQPLVPHLDEWNIRGGVLRTYVSSLDPRYGL